MSNEESNSALGELEEAMRKHIEDNKAWSSMELFDDNVEDKIA